MNLIILGKPGAGKGSLCSEFERNEDIIHISTGQIFRKEISAKTPLGILADSYISKGNLVPDDVTNEIMKNLLSKNPTAGYLFDGYPRTINQAQALTEMMKELGMKLDAVIDIDISDEVVTNRLMSRRVCANCGATYNTLFHMPKDGKTCDVCGGALTIRGDDNMDAIKERLYVYQNQTQPLIEYYTKLDKMVILNGDAKPSELYTEFVKMADSKDSLSSK